MSESKLNAVVYCQGAFGTTNGKTAHGLVRMSRRYNVVAVIDSALAGRDAGMLLDGADRDIPVVGSIDDAAGRAKKKGLELTHFVVGLAPDGGRLDSNALADITVAIESGLNVDCGLHDFLTDNARLTRLAKTNGVQLRDIRKPPPRSDLHFFTGEIEEVTAYKIAVLGTDSAVGKRTTAWKLVDAFEAAGVKAELVGTGQTAWLQGARYGVVMDSLVNDFVSGEIEHAVVTAYREVKPGVIVIEGQGSLLNPAYPGGMEILAAARPDAIVLQHAPAREEYDGFPGYRIHPLDQQIEALENVSSASVAAITINHEGMPRDAIPHVCDALERAFGIPAADVLVDGAGGVIDGLLQRMNIRADR
ncbi:MAG: DUF1611 domain-containing protein [Candidatus Latescibacterota bacterium]|jgi:uncharacterized NAD-dependent epimerase/dehydratase family protein